MFEYLIMVIMGFVVISGLISFIWTYKNTKVKNNVKLFAEKLEDSEIPLSEALKELKVVNQIEIDEKNN